MPDSNCIPPAPPLPSQNMLNNDTSITLKMTTKLGFGVEHDKICISHEDLWRACYLAHVCQNEPPRIYQFRNMQPIIQTGPNCGLTALSIFLGGNPSIQELQNTAIKLRYTNNGEMFSANYLLQLVSDHLILAFANGTTQTKMECTLHIGRLDSDEIKESLREGACIFVPYDPDFNHEPCLKRGHKAHWALIVGYLIDDNNEFYVLARHGKSVYMAIWSLKALSDSNANLLEFLQPHGYPNLEFLLPPGGISGELGLNERAIIVKGSEHEIITGP